MTTRTGWFADVSNDESGPPSEDAPWQPVLQLDGVCLDIDVWFQTEAECLRFIRDEIIGQNLLDDADRR